MGIVLDIIFALILITAFSVGYRKGLVKSVWKIAALVITIVSVMLLKEPAKEFLASSSFAETLRAWITENIHLPPGGGVNIPDALNLPEFLKPLVNSGIESAQGIAASVNDTASAALASVFISIISSVGLFIVIRLILMAAYMVITAITGAPVIKSVNKLAGGILCAVNMLFIVFVLLALAALFAPAESGLFELIDTSYIVKYLYNYNILLQIFMKI